MATNERFRKREGEAERKSSASLLDFVERPTLRSPSFISAAGLGRRVLCLKSAIIRELS